MYNYLLAKELIFCSSKGEIEPTRTYYIYLALSIKILLVLNVSVTLDT